MAASITITKWVIHPNGSVEIVNGAGEGRIYQDLATVRAELLAPLESPDHCFAYAIAYLLARSADGSNPQPILNKTLTIDFGAANPIRVQ